MMDQVPYLATREKRNQYSKYLDENNSGWKSLARTANAEILLSAQGEEQDRDHPFPGIRILKIAQEKNLTGLKITLIDGHSALANNLLYK
jgi:hypothetical protein